jgi:hypothetical protein
MHGLVPPLSSKFYASFSTIFYISVAAPVCANDFMGNETTFFHDALLFSSYLDSVIRDIIAVLSIEHRNASGLASRKLCCIS